jgi:hypothetical protein
MVTWPSGWASLEKKAPTKIATALLKVNGRRTAAATSMGVPTLRYDDPAKSTRTTAKAVEDLAKRIGYTEDRHKGIVIVKGGEVAHTDGHAAVVVPSRKRTTPMYLFPQIVTHLDMEFWASYRPVRRVSNIITWTIGCGIVSVYSHNLELGEARAWAPVYMWPKDPITFTLDDEYVWPLRDVPWTIELFPASSEDRAPVVMFRCSDARVLVNGMRS